MNTYSESEAARRAKADEVVEALRVLLPGLRIHWDDCDSDGSQYWVHFRCDAMARARPANKLAVETARRIQVAMRAATREHAASARLAWVRNESPRGIYKNFAGNKKFFDGYDSVTWIYILTIRIL